MALRGRLFVMPGTRLTNMCVPLTDNHKLFQDIVDKSPWAHPVKVYGAALVWTLAMPRAPRVRLPVSRWGVGCRLGP